MTEVYKRLGAIAPADDKEYLLYTAPAATQSLVSNITVANRSSASASFDINVYESGVTQQSDLDDTIMSNGFVALPNGGNDSAISTDGISWITGGSIPSDTWGGITYSPNIFVAVGGSPWTMNRSTKSIVSTNGISWTQGTLPSDQEWVVTYGNETFVASGAYYSYVTFQFELRASAASTDGITWTQGTLPSLGPWWSVAFGNNVFVSTAGPSYFTSNQSAVSTNGITWTVGTMPSSASWTVGYGDGKFVAAAILYPPNAVSAYSTNGISWTQGTFISSPSFSRVNNIVYGNGTFVGSMHVYGGINQSIYSTDGLSWNVSTLPESQYWGVVGFSSGVFVIMPTSQYFSNNTNIYSTNGITWTVGTMPSSDAWSLVTGSDYTSIYSSPSLNNLYKTSTIDANETQILEPGIALSASASIVAKDNSGGNLTFSTYGVELS